jgi:hypothetical protein
MRIVARLLVLLPLLWVERVWAVDWGSVSIDSERNLMLVNSTGMPFLQVLYTREQADELGFSLWGSDSDNASEDADSGGMVSAAADVEGAAYPLKGTPYGITSNPFLSPLGFPCHQPPWGGADGGRPHNAFGALEALDRHHRRPCAVRLGVSDRSIQSWWHSSNPRRADVYQWHH